MEKDSIIIEPKFWGPIKEVYDKLIHFCEEHDYENNLEIGPGKIQFPLSKKFVGCNEHISDYISCDIDEDLLPFKDGELDFVYCRHVMEDIQNPKFAIQEIIRCSKSAYIETPSPLVEMTKGIDCHSNSHLFAGYLHHRYIVWSNIQKKEIYFLPKFGCILDHMLNKSDVSKYLKNPIYWNNYFIWQEGTKPTVISYKFGVNIQGIEHYVSILNRAVIESMANTDYFFQHF
jgi:hypothetical protein